MQERHLDFSAIFESVSKFTELLLGTFDLSDLNTVLYFFFASLCFIFEK